MSVFQQCRSDASTSPRELPSGVPALWVVGLQFLNPVTLYLTTHVLPLQVHLPVPEHSHQDPVHIPVP